jgi:hypothetical protein
VVVNVASAKTLGLNDSGGIVWDLVDGRRTVSEIAHDLAERYRADLDVLTDVKRFLEALERLGVVARVDVRP